IPRSASRRASSTAIRNSYASTCRYASSSGRCALRGSRARSSRRSSSPHRHNHALPRSDGAGYGAAMSELFHDVASIDYPILDADAHVNEPPDLWQSRVPQRLRARAPKVLRTDRGDVWSFDDGKRLRPLGLTATAGLSYLQFRPEGYRYEEIRPGSFDPKARLDDLDADGIWAQVLYPSVTLAGART